MHFLHSISPPVRGQLKGNVKLTVDYIRHHSSAHKFRDYHPNVAILQLYQTFVLFEYYGSNGSSAIIRFYLPILTKM